MIAARESSVELVLQNALILYEYFNPPLFDLAYQSSDVTLAWIVDLTLRLVSVLFSAYSTLDPILEDLDFRCFRNNGRPAGFFQRIVAIFRMVVHIAAASGVVYLERSYNMTHIV